jgi:hypothetical protein
MLFRLDDPLGQFRPDTLTVAAIVGAFAGVALLMGYAIALGDPVPIALILGTIAGIALLNALPVVLWGILIGVLLISGPVTMFVPALQKGSWLFSILGFFLTGAAILYAAVGRGRFSQPMPSFVVMAILLFTFGALSLLYSGGPLPEGIRAIKRYFQFFGILFVLAVVPFRPTLVRRWWMFLIALAFVQLPFAIYQRIALVPTRQGMPGVVADDIIVGTMEGSLTGGGASGVMVLLIVSALSFMLAAYREGLLTTRSLLLLSVIVAIPFALGQVNLVVVLLPLALAVPYADFVRRRPLQLFLGVALALPALALLGWLYLTMQAVATGRPVDLKFLEIIAYNFGQVGYYGSGLNRTTVYSYWLSNQSLGDPVGFLFGHGLGSSFGGVNEMNPGHMNNAHAGMFIGLTALSAILWDLGVVGLTLIVCLHLSAVYCAYRLTLAARPGFDRALCRGLHAMALMLLVMLLYSEGPISLPSQEVIGALTLGLIAWRFRLGADGYELREQSRGE